MPVLETPPTPSNGLSNEPEDQRPTILLFGTCDTKLPQLLTLRNFITHSKLGMNLIFLDSNINSSSLVHPSITHQLPAGTYLPAYIQSLYADPSRPLHGLISVGGSNGTTSAAAAMQSLPLGIPKLIVSTMASGDTSPYIGDSDIILMPSLVDIAGRNPLLEQVLSNAAGAITGMAYCYHRKLRSTLDGPAQPPRQAIAVTQFGITTPAVSAAVDLLADQGFDTYVFHCTGSGGRLLEKFIQERPTIVGVLDLTTTELADEVVGGVLSAGPTRLSAAAEKGLPCIVSLGALDCVNFGAFETVPEEFKHRNLVRHNSAVTLMRTDKEEMRKIAELLVERMQKWTKRWCVEMLIPEGGVSALDVIGGPFWDPEADGVLFDTVTKGLKEWGIAVVRCKENINEEKFVFCMVERLVKMI